MPKIDQPPARIECSHCQHCGCTYWKGLSQCPRCNGQEDSVCPICEKPYQTYRGKLALFYGRICESCERGFERSRVYSSSRIKTAKFIYAKEPIKRKIAVVLPNKKRKTVEVDVYEVVKLVETPMSFK